MRRASGASARVGHCTTGQWNNCSIGIVCHCHTGLMEKLRCRPLAWKKKYPNFTQNLILGNGLICFYGVFAGFHRSICTNGIRKSIRISIVWLKNDPQSIQALRNYGLLKFFEILGTKAQLGLLEHLIGLWDAEERFFRLGEHILTLEINDVYFLTGLSRRGDHVNLVGKRPSRLSTEALIHTHYRVGAKKSGGKITITDVRIFPLKEILYTIYQSSW